MGEKNRIWTKWLYWFTFAVAVIFVYKTLDNFTDITNWLRNLFNLLMPFILAVIIAYLFYIPCKRVEQLYKKRKFNLLKKHSRVLSVFTIYFIAFCVIIILFNVILPIVSESLLELASNLPNYYNNAISYVENLPEDSWINELNLQDIISSIQNIDISSIFSLENLLNYIKGAIGIVNVLFTVFVTIVVSIYLLIERTEIMQFVRSLSRSIFKEETSKKLGYYFEKINEIFFKFISSQIFDGFVVGTILSIAMSLMGIKYAVLLGFMIGLFNIIPYFGAIVAVAIAILITIFTGGLGQAIWMGIITIILQQIDANIINPKILGTSLSLSPILVIFSVTIGGAYFGILGMFLAVPITTTIKLLLKDFISSKQLDKNLA